MRRTGRGRLVLVMPQNWNVARRQSEPSDSRTTGADHLTIVPRKNLDNQACPAAERSPLFNGILAGDYSGISATARVKVFARGERLYLEGDSVKQVMLISAGFVKITQLGNGGTEVIIRICGSGDVLGAVGLLSTVPHRTTAEAFRDCRALVWEASAFRSLVGRYPILHQNMVRILGHDLLELEARFREVATERVGPRVARQLVRLLEQIGRPVINGNGEMEVCLSREDLAQMTGTTLFTVSRLLSAWEALGMVKPRREAVGICDVQSLRAITE
jgi:CRP/FNR family transcriptional regulator, nitrogen oxide reductase regulator